MLTARALYDRAVADANAGRLGSAQRLLDLAAARLPADDPDLPALVLGTRAYLLAQRSDPAGAAALCREALALSGLSRECVAIVSGQLGLALIHSGDLLAAGPVLDVAVRGLEQQPARLAQVLLNRGQVAWEVDDLTTADRSFERAVRLFSELGDVVGAAKARHNGATLAMLRGDLVTALRGMDLAREVLAPLSPAAAATCEADRAELLVTAGMPREAVGPLERAAAAYGRAGMRRAQAGVELVLSQTVLEPRRASTLARRAARRFGAAGDAAGALRARAVAVELALQAAHPRRSELAEAAELAGALADAGLRDAARSLRRNLVRGHVRAGDLPAANELLRGLRPLSSEHVTARVLHAEVAAEVAAGQGRHREAQRLAARGMALVTGWSERYEDLDLRTSLALHARRVLVTGIASALATDDPALVLQWSELTRGVASRPTPVRSPAGLDLTAARHEGDPSDRPLASTPGAAWRETPAAVTAGGPDLERLLATLHEQQAVALAYVRTDDEVAVVTLDGAAGHPGGARGQGRGRASGRGRVTLTRLASWSAVEAETSSLLADLDMAASTLHPLLADSVRASLRHRLGRLERLLLPPDLPATGRLVVTAPPAIGAVPWTLLPRLAGTAVTVPETLADWVRRAGVESERGAAEGAVVEGAAAEGVERPPLRAGIVVGPGLEHATTEAAAVARLWGAACTVLDGDAASVSAVSALAARVDVLHVVAHGHHATGNPLFSGFELADGPWFGYDIELLERVPEVVVLSSCELGRSAQVWGMELVGMARAWLHAGARTVVAAPARVPDALSTAIPALHLALAVGASPAEALAIAGLAATGSGTGRSGGGGSGTADPVGAFTCFGSGW